MDSPNFSVLRTVSVEMVSTTSSATSRSASGRRVHRAWPSGGAEQAIIVSLDSRSKW